MNGFVKVIAYLLSLILLVAAFYLGGGVPFKEQMLVYDGLRNTSAIIFAVMGAWIALLYPKKLSQAFGKKPYEDKVDDINQIDRLFKPMIYSTGVLVVVIGMSFAVPLAKQVSLLVEHREVFRSISFSMIAALTILQFWSLILTLVPGDSIKDDLEEIRSKEEMLERMRPGRRNNTRKR